MIATTKITSLLFAASAKSLSTVTAHGEQGKLVMMA